MAQVAWAIGVQWPGRGLATEAASAMVGWLQEQGLHGITANIHPAHSASQAVARKAGLSPTDEVIDSEVVWQRRRRAGAVWRSPDS